MKNFLFGARTWRVLLCLSYVLRVQFLTALPTDTTSFDFRTTGHGAQSFQAQLHIDSLGGSMNLMPFCDQIFYGSLRDPHIVLEKSSNFLSSGCFPLRSYYPLRIMGEGWLTSSGDKGWFFVPPNVLPGDTNVFLPGVGPHKVYWLSADHPDGVGVESMWDGRRVKSIYTDGRWIKRIRLP